MTSPPIWASIRSSWFATATTRPRSASRRVPPVDRDLWVIEVLRPDRLTNVGASASQSLVCFASGTLISTPGGRRPVEALVPGDRIETRDNGPQPVIWTGYTEITTAQAARNPDLMPIQISSGAFGPGAPGERLVVSPNHRILVAGSAALALFNVDEVLVPASELADDLRVRQIQVQVRIRYHHVMLESHQILWASGLACESFHPADTDLLALADPQRLAFVDAAPDSFRDPMMYGGHARRCLTSAESALLRYGI